MPRTLMLFGQMDESPGSVSQVCFDGRIFRDTLGKGFIVDG